MAFMDTNNLKWFKFYLLLIWLKKRCFQGSYLLFQTFWKCYNALMIATMILNHIFDTFLLGMNICLYLVAFSSDISQHKTNFGKWLKDSCFILMWSENSLPMPQKFFIGLCVISWSFFIDFLIYCRWNLFVIFFNFMQLFIFFHKLMNKGEISFNFHLYSISLCF